jgi:hypothetical protein
MYKLKNGIDIEEIKNCYSLSANPNAIDFLESNPDKICWEYFII